MDFAFQYDLINLLIIYLDLRIIMVNFMNYHFDIFMISTFFALISCNIYCLIYSKLDCAQKSFHHFYLFDLLYSLINYNPLF
jgi:hypothetical protein